MRPRPHGRWCDQHQRCECVHPRKAGRGPCHGPAVTGSDACRMHLGEEAQPVIAEAKLEQAAARLLYQRDAPPVTDPLTALQKLAGRAAAWEDVIGEKVNELRSLRYSTDEGGEQLRAEIIVMERAMDRLGRLLLDIAKLGIEERLAGIREKTALMLEAALDAALAASGVDLNRQAAARETFRKHLVVLPGPEDTGS
jgi:hypothetical protein